MRKDRKPGPKSRTKNGGGFVGDLGDTSTDSEESNNQFASPEVESNATDYGLDYTNNSPRRSLRSQVVPHSAAVPPRPVRQSTAPPRPAAAAAPANNNERRRKQKTPRQREMLFWKDVRKLQQTTQFLIPRRPFGLLVRELIYSNSTEVNRITLEALEALQTSTEKYVTQRLQDAYLLSLHCKRTTLMLRDLNLIQLLKDA